MMQDVYFEDKSCSVWAEILPDPIYYPCAGELVIALVNEAIMPDDNWLSYEISHGISIQDVLGITDVPKFLMTEGLFIGQRFFIKFDPPHFYKCNHPLDPEEWDCDYNWDIVTRAKQRDVDYLATMGFLLFYIDRKKEEE